MFDDFQTSIPWKTIFYSRHAPEMTREEKRKKEGREKRIILINLEFQFQDLSTVFKSPFLRFGAIHIPLTQPGCLLSTLGLHHP